MQLLNVQWLLLRGENWWGIEEGCLIILFDFADMTTGCLQLKILEFIFMIYYVFEVFFLRGDEEGRGKEARGLYLSIGRITGWLCCFENFKRRKISKRK